MSVEGGQSFTFGINRFYLLLLIRESHWWLPSRGPRPRFIPPFPTHRTSKFTVIEPRKTTTENTQQLH